MTQRAEKAKEFLEGYKTAYYKLVYAKERNLLYKSQILSSPRFTGTPGKSKKRDLSDYIISIEKVIAETKATEAKQIEIMCSIRNAIERVENDKDRQILFYKYIEFMSFRQIAREMDMSKNAVYIRHGKTLERFPW